MRALLTILLLIYTPASVPQMTELEWWQTIGAPCTTKIDKLEGTCRLEVKQKPIWK